MWYPEIGACIVRSLKKLKVRRRRRRRRRRISTSWPSGGRQKLLPTSTHHQLSVSGRHVLHIFRDLIVEYIHTCQNMCDGSSCYISNYSKITDAAVSHVCSHHQQILKK